MKTGDCTRAMQEKAVQLVIEILPLNWLRTHIQVYDALPSPKSFRQHKIHSLAYDLALVVLAEERGWKAHKSHQHLKLYPKLCHRVLELREHREKTKNEKPTFKPTGPETWDHTWNE